MGWLGAFALTQVVEVPLHAWALRRAGWTGWKLGALALLPSTLTHPILWAGFPALRARWSYEASVAVAEVVVVAVEAWVLAWLMKRGRTSAVAARGDGGAPWVRGLVVSSLANALSVGVGLVTRACFGWP